MKDRRQNQKIAERRFENVARAVEGSISATRSAAEGLKGTVTSMAQTAHSLDFAGVEAEPEVFTSMIEPLGILRKLKRDFTDAQFLMQEVASTLEHIEQSFGNRIKHATDEAEERFTHPERSRRQSSSEH